MRPGTLLALLSFFSGAGGLACEVLYFRSLTVFLGDMYYVHAALVAVFLLGLGFGAWSARRFASRLHIFELAAGAYAFLFPFLARAYEGSRLADLLPHPGAQAVLGSALLLAVPAIAMGFSVPLFAAYLKRQGGGTSALPAAYALYNAGAAAGVLLMEFGAVRVFGVAASLRLLGALSLAAGLALWLRPDLRLAEEPAGADGERLTWRAYPALFLASLGGALFSAFFLKAGYHLFLPNRENFAVCTAASLLAIAAGTWVVRRAKTDFADCALFSAFGIAAVYAAFPALSAAYALLLAGVSSEAAAVLLKLAFALLLGGLPALWFWGAIPALAAGSGALARDSGRLLLVSGLGNAAGLLLFTFVLHPRFSLFTSPAAAAALLAAAALVYAGPRLLPRRAFLLAGMALLLWRVAGLPQDLVYGVNSVHDPGAVMVHFKSASDNVAYVRGRTQSSIVHNGVEGVHFLTAGNVNVAETVYGVLPALAAPRRDSALVLGLGTGMTAGITASLFGHTDIVEINGACLPLLPILADANMRVARNPRANIVHDDGRRFLARSRRPYDAIVSTLPPPDYAAAAKLHTREFYQLVKRSLAPDGVYLLWFTFKDMSNAGVETTLATLAGNFRHCALALVRANYYVLICSDSEVKMRSAAAAGIAPEVKKAVETGADGADAMEHFDNILLTRDIFPRPAREGARLNSDDFPVLEFQIAAARYSKNAPADQVAMDPKAFNIHLLNPGEPGFLDQALILSYAHPAMFQRWVWPALYSSPETMKKFLDYMVGRLGSRQKMWGADAWLQLALFAEKSGDLTRAQEYCRNAVDKAPLNARAAAMMSRLYSARKDAGQARTWALRARVLGGL